MIQAMVIFMAVALVCVAVISLVDAFKLLPKKQKGETPDKNLRRIEAVIPYLTDDARGGVVLKTVKKKVEEMLGDELAIGHYEREVREEKRREQNSGLADELIAKHHPEALQKRIKELEDELGIGDSNGVAPVRPKSWWKRS